MAYADDLLLSSHMPFLLYFFSLRPNEQTEEAYKEVSCDALWRAHVYGAHVEVGFLNPEAVFNFPTV